MKADDEKTHLFKLSLLILNVFPNNCSFIVNDCRQQELSNDQIMEQLSFFSDHLTHSGCLVLILPVDDISIYHSLLETSFSSIKMNHEGASYIQSYLYDVAPD